MPKVSKSYKFSFSELEEVNYKLLEGSYYTGIEKTNNATFLSCDILKDPYWNHAAN